MSIAIVIARFLDEELRARGVNGLSMDDCVEIARNVIDRTAELAEKVVEEASSQHLPRDPV